MVITMIAIGKMSSKGQVVIPEEMRNDKGMKEGDSLVFMDNKDQIIIKKASKMNKQLAEDIEFARRTEEAYKQLERGESTTSTVDEFLEEMKKW